MLSAVRSKLRGAWSPGFQGKILVLAVTAAVVTAGCSMFIIVQTRANIQAQVFNDQAALGQSYALVVQEYLNGPRSVLEGLATVPALRATMRVEAVRTELRGVPSDSDPDRRAMLAASIAASRRMKSMIIVLPSGQLYMVEPYATQLAFSAPTLETPSLERALTTGRAAWSDVLISSVTHLPAVALQVPILDRAGSIQGLLGSTLDLGQLVEDAHGIRPGTTGAVMLFDRYGIPIIYPDPSRVSAAQPLTDMPLVQYALDGRTGPFAYYNPLTGGDELGTAVPLDNGWFAMVTQSQAEAFAGLNQTTTTLLGVLGLGVLALFAAGLMLAISIATRARLAARTADHERAEEALEHQSLHDALTGLPNRALFVDRLDHAFGRADRETSLVAVLFLDLDNFRLINDSLDHDAGDLLLMSVGQRLLECVAPTDTVARLGGDEFSILLEDVPDAGAALACAKRIQEHLRWPLVLNGHELFPTASIGIAVSGPESRSPKGLLRDADAAMCRAKTRG